MKKYTIDLHGLSEVQVAVIKETLKHDGLLAVRTSADPKCVDVRISKDNEFAIILGSGVGDGDSSNEHIYSILREVSFTEFFDKRANYGWRGRLRVVPPGLDCNGNS